MPTFLPSNCAAHHVLQFIEIQAQERLLHTYPKPEPQRRNPITPFSWRTRRGYLTVGDTYKYPRDTYLQNKYPGDT